MTINFIKMHGLKNDFVIIDGRENKIYLTKNHVKKIANRKSGLGCDQVSLLEKLQPQLKIYMSQLMIHSSNLQKHQDNLHIF